MSKSLNDRFHLHDPGCYYDDEPQDVDADWDDLQFFDGCMDCGKCDDCIRRTRAAFEEMEEHK